MNHHRIEYSREGEGVDDEGDARGEALDRPLQRGPRVSAIGAERVEERLHDHGVVPRRGASVGEPVVPARDRGLAMGGPQDDDNDDDDDDEG